MSSPRDYGHRIATSSAEAASGYANAAVAAYVDFAGQMLGAWAQTVDTMMGGKEPPKSWYRHPEREQQLSFFGAPAWTWWAQPFAGGAAGQFNPFLAWTNAWPLQGNPAAWPMAFAMIGMGVSRSVAFPLAQANTAALDAARAAGQAIEEGFSSYRSDGGHASAQIRFSGGNAMASVLPFGVALMAPWMAAISDAARSL